ncbi:uncharacterized protein VTP21DRAFT_10917 [Calcarisporiella thermophila]|uniref:uncharacterized protein n=1 Tax=Calcarisporiella thermophila TaxID=911321 RepID=UPI00374319FF
MDRLGLIVGSIDRPIYSHGVGDSALDFTDVCLMFMLSAPAAVKELDEKHVHFEGKAFDYFSSKPVSLADNAEASESEEVYPTGLLRIREDKPAKPDPDSSPSLAPRVAWDASDLARFTTESLHSFSFAAPDAALAAARRSVLTRSVEFMRSRIKDWSLPKFALAYFPSLGQEFRDKLATQPKGTDAAESELEGQGWNEPPCWAAKTSPSLKRAFTDIRPIPSRFLALVNRSNSLDAVPSLHSPTRFVPHNQGMITTDAEGVILTASDIACIIFGFEQNHLVGRNALDLLPASIKEKYERLIRTRVREEAVDAVLVCGKVIPIAKRDGTTSAASLWLKAKKDSKGAIIFIWIFEEISELVITVGLSGSGIIGSLSGPFQDLYGYSENELLGKSITILIPAFAGLYAQQWDSPQRSGMDTLDAAEINRLKFFGSWSKRGVSFPIIVKLEPLEGSTGQFSLKIVSIPTMAGLVIAQQDGRIQSANMVFAKYLFGVHSQEMIEGRRVTEFLPQFMEMIEELAYESSLENGTIVSSAACRRASKRASLPPTPRLRTGQSAAPESALEQPAETPLPLSAPPTANASLNLGMVSSVALPTNGITAVHRDGTHFDIDLQIRVVESCGERLFALWLSYDRGLSIARRSSQSAPTTPHALEPTALALTASFGSLVSLMPEHKVPPEARTSVPEQAACAPPEVKLYRDEAEVSGEEENAVDDAEMTPVKSAAMKVCDAPPSPTKDGLPSLQIKMKKQYSIPSDVHPVTPPPLTTPPESLYQYSILLGKRSIDDYVVVHTLGQGAYGTVKLAYRKDDPTKRKLVLKYVVKSRILLDCWTKDKVLGIVPLEIHVLHTLRRIPHPSILNMVDFFEDDEHYYIESELHGAGMDLFDYIELNCRGLMESEVRSIFRKVCEAVQHLHHHRIVHRDIKDENVILDGEGGVQLIDFGSAAYLRQGRLFDTFCGTLDYAAPEVISGKKYTGPPQDVWALGILLYTIIFRENPFYTIDEIMARELRIPFILSPGSIELIKWMLNRDVEKRPTIDEVLAHPWLQIQ